MVAVPRTRLSSRLRRAVDSVRHKWSARGLASQSEQLSSIPHSSGLEIRRGTRQDSSSDGLARFTAIHDALGNWGEFAARGMISYVPLSVIDGEPYDVQKSMVAL